MFFTWLECSPMARKTCVQSQIESYQRLKKWYLMLPCFTLSIIRYGSRVKWINPGKGITPPLHFGVVAIEKGAFGSPLTMFASFTLLDVFSTPWIALSTQSSMLVSLLAPYFLLHWVYLGCKTLYFISNFLDFWSIWVPPLFILRRVHYYYYFTHSWVLHTSVNWWFSTRIWVIASLLKSPGIFLIFWPISTMLK